MSKRKRALEDMSGMALSKRLAFNTAAEFQILTGPDIYKNRPRVLDTSNLRSSEIDNFIASEYRLMDVINTMVAQLDGVQGSQQLQKVSQTASYSWQRPIAIDPGYHKIHRKTYGGGRAKVRVDRDRRRVTVCTSVQIGSSHTHVSRLESFYLRVASNTISLICLCAGIYKMMGRGRKRDVR